MVEKKISGLKQSVRILLVGEKGVGKTSIILSLVSEEFPEDVPAKAEEITIPADVTPEQIPTHIVDYSAIEQSDEQLIEEVRKAHVICVIFSVEDEDTLEKVTTKWLPFIKENLLEDELCPVILVGNKADLTNYTTIDEMRKIMDDHSEIESCIECSAKTLQNISLMFYYAQKSVLHPTSPLYVAQTRDLTPDCKEAFKRIFKICDLDSDGLLNDSELDNFQMKCFKGVLRPQILEDLKYAIKKNLSDGLENNSITLSGFLLMHCLFIQKGRSETVWRVLKKFGYDDKLNMSSDYLHPQINVSPGCTTELSYKGQKFFTSLFERHDKDKDGALSPAELVNLFSTCPAPAWGSEIYKNVPLTKKEKWITLNGFICEWTLITLFDVTKTLEYLAYLGYNLENDEDQLSAIQVTREKKIDLAKRQTSRNVYQCLVIGSEKSGKTTFCLGLLNYNVEDAADMLEDIKPESQCTINVVHVYGQEKYLVLKDIDVKNVESTLEAESIEFDVACLIYSLNDPKSFELIAKIYLNYFADTKIPVLIVETKSDLPKVQQDYVMQPAAFCSLYKLPPPQCFSAQYQIHKEVYVKLATMAAFPSFQAAWVMFRRKQTSRLQQNNFLPIEIQNFWKAGVTLAAATAVGYWLVKILRSDAPGR